MISIERLGDLRLAAQLKPFFAAHGLDRVAASYERFYADVFAAGGAAWVARDQRGAVAMHVSCLPRPLRTGERAVRGAIVGDLLAAPEYRDFFSPVRLLREAVGSLRSDGVIEVLLSDPTPPAAAVCRAAGFEAFGELRRFAAPTHLLWRLASSLRSGTRGLSVRAYPPDDPMVARACESSRMTSVITANRRPGDFGRRYPQGIAPEGVCVVAHPAAGGGAAPVGVAFLVFGPKSAWVADLRWSEEVDAAAPLLLGAAREARSRGYARVSASALDGSVLADRLRTAGFLARADRQPIGMRILGDCKLPPARQWALTALDGSAW